MIIKCIALDLDGTVLLDDGSMTKRTENAIQTAISNGIHIIVASGRCFDSLPVCLENLEGIEFAVTSNGASIYRITDGKCIKSYPVPLAAVDYVMNKYSGKNTAFEVFYEGRAFASDYFVNNTDKYGFSENVSEYIKATRNSVEDINAFIFNHKNELESIDIIASDKSDSLRIFKDVSAIPGVYVTTSISGRIEISSENAGKHKGMEFVLEQLGISREETVAFGNADNDMEMLHFAKYGFAVSDASENCKKAADFVIPPSFDDGVASVLEQIHNMGENEIVK